MENKRESLKLQKLNLHATTDGASAYKNADFVIVAAPTNYDPKTDALVYSNRICGSPARDRASDVSKQ